MTLYEKRGRRYYPVSDVYAYDGLGNGAWLVVVEQGYTSIRRLVSPDHAALEAALVPARERMERLIIEKSAQRPFRSLLTPKERRAMKAYCDVMGPDAMLVLVKPCAAEIVDAVLDEVVYGQQTDRPMR